MHVPIIGGCSYPDYGNTVRAGRSSNTPGTSPPVGAERSRITADLQTSTLRSCNRCAGQLALAARPGARRLYKIAVLTFKVLHGIAPEYLGPVVRIADLPGRQFLRSVGTNCLHGSATV